LFAPLTAKIEASNRRTRFLAGSNEIAFRADAARGWRGCSITLAGNHGADGIVVAMFPHTASNM
jgi:hypothetical protein